jgi:putative sterol carrier protein
MGLKFGTEPWVNAYAEKLNANPAYEEAAKTWEGDFVFIIEPSGNLDHEVRFYVDLYHGKARSWKALNAGDTMEAAFEFAGPWENYDKLIEGELDPIKGLMTKKFSLKGDMKKVMRAVKAAKQLVETIKQVDTEKY